MPLRNIKVLELAGIAPGPFCGMILSDFGASVIRIDKASDSPQTILDVLGNGKKSIGLDIRTKEGAGILKKMSDRSDVLVDPYRPGVMEKFGLGPEVLCKSNEKLIYARLTGFGQFGPYANMAGHDINYVALSGLLSLFGEHGEKPKPPVTCAADFGGGGLTCALGIILALFERTRSEKGQVVDCSMVEGTAYLGSWLYRSQKIPGLWGQPRGKNLLDGGVPFYDTYETKDGKFMAVAAVESQFAKNFLGKLGIRKADISQFDNVKEAGARLTNIFKGKTQEEWCAIFDGTDACVTPVLSLECAPIHRHNTARSSFAKSESENIPSPAPKLSRTPGYTRDLDKPLLMPGENSTDILLECGFKPDEIQGFIERGTVYEKDVSNKLGM